MKLPKRVRQIMGARMLRNEAEPVRLRKGFNFHSAQNVGLIYLDSDEQFYNEINNFSKLLKSDFDIRKVLSLAFVDEIEKKIPAWQIQNEHSTFFTRKDLNWHMRPTSGMENFISEDFDILIDFSGGNSLPLNFIMKESRAKMKVGLRGTKAERYCDFILNMGNQFGISSFVEQLNSYLSNPKIR
jgi:hypothetical protein